MRSPLAPLHHYPVGHDAGLQEAADDPEHPLIPDPVVWLSHEHVVVHAVEELLQIHVHHPLSPVLDIPLSLPHRIVRSAPRPEAVAVLAEGRIEHRLQHLQQQLLNESVEHGRDTQPPHPSPALRYRLSLHRTRLVAPRQQLLSDRPPVLARIRLQFRYRPTDVTP